MTLSVAQGDVPAVGGLWTVVGGPDNGSIDADGTFHAPPALPLANQVTISYSLGGVSASAQITLLNPTPILTTATPNAVHTPSTIVLMGSGFVPTSSVLLNGQPVSTTYVDASHLSAVLPLAQATTHLSVAVRNPDPGGVTTASLDMEIQTGAITVSATQSTVRIGRTATFVAVQDSRPALDGSWGVVGGTGNGTIDRDGTFHPPATVPTPNRVNVTYTPVDPATSFASASIEILNPVPVLTSVNPTIAVGLTPILVTGSGFTATSKVTIGTVPVATTFVDDNHLRATLSSGKGTVTSVQISVANPDPGASSANIIAIDALTPEFTVSPATLPLGNVSITLTGRAFPPNAVVYLDGKPLTVDTSSSTSISASGYLPPWKSGTLIVSIAADATSDPVEQAAAQVMSTPISFDTAARFSTQAAFGPRPDVVLHIQQVGLDGFITEQLNMPPPTFDPTKGAHTQFLRGATNGSTLLRLRVAWAFQTFMVSACLSGDISCEPYEVMLERDSTGNFRDLLTDLCSDPSMGEFLNLAGNDAPTDPSAHPNRNFARELMQLFTLGPVLLANDGTLIRDASGNPAPTYTEAQVNGLSRVFTGWERGPITQPLYTQYGVDYSSQLSANDNHHDHGSKTIVGGVTIPAALGIVKDRQLALDAIFQHPNLPPFISRILIQRLVKSDPSSAYVDRIASVFKDDGTGVRGNLSSVIRALLLDPEARSGDTAMSDSDGFLQEPLLAQVFFTTAAEVPIWDDQPDYYATQLGEHWWHADTVFGYYPPDYVIPGSSINSPEFATLNNITAIVRSEYVWDMLIGAAPGYGEPTDSWLYTNFRTIPDLVDAIDHLAFHGHMPLAQKSAIVAYCAKLDPRDMPTQRRSAMFLAFTSPSFTVSH